MKTRQQNIPSEYEESEEAERLDSESSDDSEYAPSSQEISSEDNDQAHEDSQSASRVATLTIPDAINTIHGAQKMHAVTYESMYEELLDTHQRVYDRDVEKAALFDRNRILNRQVKDLKEVISSLNLQLREAQEQLQQKSVVTTMVCERCAQMELTVTTTAPVAPISLPTEGIPTTYSGGVSLASHTLTGSHEQTEVVTSMPLPPHGVFPCPLPGRPYVGASTYASSMPATPFVSSSAPIQPHPIIYSSHFGTLPQYNMQLPTPHHLPSPFQALVSSSVSIQPNPALYSSHFGLVPDILGSGDANASSELCRAWGQIKTDEMGPAYTASTAAPGHEVVVTPLIRKLRLHIQGYVGHEEFSIMPLEGCDVLLDEYAECFSKAFPGPLSRERLEDHYIDLISGSAAPNKPLQSRRSSAKRDYDTDQLEDSPQLKVDELDEVLQLTYFILVYEYVPNGNLHSHLFGRAADHSFGWLRRLDIAVGIAQGLDYLHSFADPPVIHRDVKPSNILLDNNLLAKVADFGISRTTIEFETHISTTPAGTAGYIDPQYFLRRQLTTASDVYGFGVVLLELITGQKAIDPTRIEDHNLVEWVKIKMKMTGIEGLIDPRIKDDCPLPIYETVAQLAISCASFNKNERPQMKEAVAVLDKCLQSTCPPPISLFEEHPSREYYEAAIQVLEKEEGDSNEGMTFSSTLSASKSAFKGAALLPR
ncbi:hypothetical protein L7F22_001918 [Adiantum nelumboides]|nr:hypothetical protein [Adiantum nelumboides]